LQDALIENIDRRGPDGHATFQRQVAVAVIAKGIDASNEKNTQSVCSLSRMRNEFRMNYKMFSNTVGENNTYMVDRHRLLGHWDAPPRRRAFHAPAGVSPLDRGR
jgi:hypothetical protein